MDYVADLTKSIYVLQIFSNVLFMCDADKYFFRTNNKNLYIAAHCASNSVN